MTYETKTVGCLLYRILPAMRQRLRLRSEVKPPLPWHYNPDEAFLDRRLVHHGQTLAKTVEREIVGRLRLERRAATREPCLNPALAAQLQVEFKAPRLPAGRPIGVVSGNEMVEVFAHDT